MCHANAVARVLPSVTLEFAFFDFVAASSLSRGLVPQVYIDTRGRKLWGQQAWLAAKKEKGEPLNTRGGSRGVVRKRKSSSGGHHKRKSGGGKRAKK